MALQASDRGANAGQRLSFRLGWWRRAIDADVVSEFTRSGLRVDTIFTRPICGRFGVSLIAGIVTIWRGLVFLFHDQETMQGSRYVA